MVSSCYSFDGWNGSKKLTCLSREDLSLPYQACVQENNECVNLPVVVLIAKGYWTVYKYVMAEWLRDVT
jgi:hypothetical protein